MELYIQHNDEIYSPLVKDEITWELERRCVPGKLTFTVMKDSVIDFQEGNYVTFKVAGKNIFKGFVFTKQRDKEGLIKVTAYDQLRYLKNKFTYVLDGKTATELVHDIAQDFGLVTGVLEETGHKISRIEENKTLVDMINAALQDTVVNRQKLYVLHDDFGSLTLKNISSMKLDLVINDQTAQDFNYKTSIDDQTFSKIVLTQCDETAGKYNFYTAKDDTLIKSWGVLQYFDSLDVNFVNGQNQANALLKLYDQKTRSLSIDKAFGDVKVRAGSLIGVSLDIGDVILNNFMMVDKVKHVFKENEHTMNLNLVGGEFV